MDQELVRHVRLMIVERNILQFSECLLKPKYYNDVYLFEASSYCGIMFNILQTVI